MAAERLPSGLQQPFPMSMGKLYLRVAKWPPPRGPYVYVPASGRGARTIAIGDIAAWCSFAASADGRELLYISNWQLKAAPLPPEARRQPGR
jgi:hypothetical protein